MLPPRPPRSVRSLFEGGSASPEDPMARQRPTSTAAPSTAAPSTAAPSTPRPTARSTSALEGEATEATAASPRSTRSSGSPAARTSSAPSPALSVPVGTNLVVLRGTLSRDAELRTLPSGDQVVSCDVTVAATPVANEPNRCPSPGSIHPLEPSRWPLATRSWSWGGFGDASSASAGPPPAAPRWSLTGWCRHGPRRVCGQLSSRRVPCSRSRRDHRSGKGSGPMAAPSIPIPVAGPAWAHAGPGGEAVP